MSGSKDTFNIKVVSVEELLLLLLLLLLLFSVDDKALLVSIESLFFSFLLFSIELLLLLFGTIENILPLTSKLGLDCLAIFIRAIHSSKIGWVSNLRRKLSQIVFKFRPSVCLSQSFPSTASILEINMVNCLSICLAQIIFPLIGGRSLTVLILSASLLV